MKTKLYFIRHAEAEGNRDRIFHGWTDAKLTDKGYMQAEKVAAKLRDIDIDVIYASTLSRAKETARHIAEKKNLPVLTTEYLKEINGGFWENEKWVDIPTKWPSEYYTWENQPHTHSMPDGESMEDFQKRLILEVKNIIDENEGKSICIVTHGTAIKALLCYFYGCTLEEMLNIKWADNTSVTEIDYVDGTFKVISEGDNSHLSDELSTIKHQKWWETNQENIEIRNKLISMLFETKALQVCPEDNPFWYTSGTIGPYYINTHFLYGNKEKANLLLEKIDKATQDKMKCSKEIFDEVLKNYNEDSIYKSLIDELCNFIKDKVDVSQVQYISGGERRDWFFSLMAAKILKKPHLTIYKDMEVVMFDGVESYEIKNLGNAKILHIADLITEASSYIRAWIPAIKKLNGEIIWSVAIVDRNQGGEERLGKEKIISQSMIYIDKNLFDKALKLELVNRNQYQMILDYLESPRDSMKKFLETHAQFLQTALKSDQRTRDRAKLCLEKDIYELELS